MRHVDLTLPDGLFVRVEAVRGQTPRNAWIRKAMEVSDHVRVEEQHDSTWTVYVTPGTNWWGTGIDFPDEEAALLVARLIDRLAVGFAGSPRAEKVA